MEKERIKQAYFDYRDSELMQSLNSYRKLSDGKSADVYFDDVKRRVNMEYMGLVNEGGYCPSYKISNGAVVTSGVGYNLKDLIVPSTLMAGTTRLYSEFATSKPLLSNKEEFESLKVDLDDFLGRLMVVQSWAGKQLIKGIIREEGISLTNITPKDYFRVPNEYNARVTDAYVIYSFNAKEKILLCEIYELNSLELRAYSLQGDFEEVKYPFELEMAMDGLGYKEKLKGWGVVEVQNIFGKSDYTDDLLGIVREIVVGDTITSQAFQKVANPLLQVPDSLIEYGEDGTTGRIRLDDRAVIVSKDDKDIKQVAMETKTQEWNIQRKELMKEFYKAVGVNDVAFGIDVSGAFTSGDAKEKSLERIIATVSSKRNKCIKGMKEVINWALQESGINGTIEIEPQEILVSTMAERVAIACQSVASGIMSISRAIEYVGISQDTEKEMNDIKKDIVTQEKIVNMLNVIGGIYHEEEMKDKVDTLTKELLEELGV